MPEEFRYRSVVFDLHGAREIQEAAVQANPNLYSAAEHQVRSEIEAAQAQELRRLIPNPFVELTWARLVVATDPGQHSDGGDINEESEKETVSRPCPWYGGGWTAEPGDRIVYGCVDNGLVFISVTQAEQLAGIYVALGSVARGVNSGRSFPTGSTQRS